MEHCPNSDLYRYLYLTTTSNDGSVVPSPSFHVPSSASAIGDRRRLDEDVVRSVVRDVVMALMFLHAQGIVHRDLKLSNLLLDANYRLV